MALKQTEVSQVGSSIAMRPVNTPNTAPFDYFPLLNVKSITGTFISDYGTAQDYNDGLGPAITRSHPYDDLAQVTVYFIDENLTPLRIDLQQVSNQPTWTPDEAGVAQATEDINSWVAIAVLGGVVTPPTGLATEVTLQSVLSAIQDGQDFEAKSVVDGNGTTYLEVRIWNPDTQTWETPLYYAPGSNVGVGIGSLTAPVTYLNTQTTLSSILAEMVTLNAVDFSTETTLNDLLTAFNAKDFATETTLDAQASDVAKLVGFAIGEYDEIDMTYIPAGNGVGEVGTVVYSLAAAPVATLTLTYDASNRLINVTKS